MSIKREDLIAAANAGVLPYKQVDPMLIFLLQRDMQQQRTDMLHEKTAGRIRPRHVLFYLAAILSIGVLTWLAALYTKIAFDALGAGGLLWFIALYAFFTVVLATWFERRRVGISVSIFITSAVSLVPLVVFAAQQLHML